MTEKIRPGRCITELRFFYPPKGIGYMNSSSVMNESSATIVRKGRLVMINPDDHNKWYKWLELEVIIDPTFNEEFTLPKSVIDELSLKKQDKIKVVVNDESYEYELEKIYGEKVYGCTKLEFNGKHYTLPVFVSDEKCHPVIGRNGIEHILGVYIKFPIVDFVGWLLLTLFLTLVGASWIGYFISTSYTVPITPTHGWELGSLLVPSFLHLFPLFFGIVMIIYGVSNPVRVLMAYFQGKKWEEKWEAMSKEDEAHQLGLSQFKLQN